MEYLNILQNIGAIVFALVFWYMCYKLEKVVSTLKN